MILQSLFKDSWTVLGVCDQRKRCQVVELIAQLPSNLEKDGDRLIALLERVSQRGPQELPDDRSRSIIDSEGIWEFRQGRIRVLWFYDEGRLVICTNGFIKRKQKTPRGEVRTAEATKREYFRDKEAGFIEIIEDEV